MPVLFWILAFCISVLAALVFMVLWIVQCGKARNKTVSRIQNEQQALPTQEWFPDRSPSTLIIVHACYNVEVVERCLESLMYTMDAIAVVVENPSPRSEEMKSMVSKFKKRRLVYKHIMMNENFWGFPYLYPAAKGKLKEFLSLPFVCLTDGDVEFEPDCFGWLDECTTLLKKHTGKLGLVAVEVDRSNFPPWATNADFVRNWKEQEEQKHRTQEGYYRARTGFQMVCMPKPLYMQIVSEFIQDGTLFLDSNLYGRLERHGLDYAVTENNVLYHIGWDIYTDYHKKKENSEYAGYIKFKQESIVNCEAPPTYTGCSVLHNHT